MKTLKSANGKLKMDVSSEGNYIRAGSDVIVEQIEDNFGNLSVLVTSIFAQVRLPFYDTRIDWLV